MNRQEIKDTVHQLRRFRSNHVDYLSEQASAHIFHAISVMEAVAAAVPDAPAAVVPSNRVNGMCPCELADAVKSAGS